MSLPDYRREPPPPAPPRGWQALVVQAIERGNWRFVLHNYDPFAAAAQGRSARFLSIVGTIAEAMRWQALGLLPLASDTIAEAARMLPLAMYPRRSASGLVDLVPQPAGEQGLEYWTWRAARVAWREQQEMLDLKVELRYAESPDALRAALTERRRCVDLDPWTWGPIVRDDGIDLMPSRRDLLDRATDLLQYASPTARALTPHNWKMAGGYAGIYAAAMRLLATSDLVPWAGANPLARGIPVRCGRCCVRREAKLWAKLTNAEC